MDDPARAAQRIFDDRKAGKRFAPAAGWFEGFDLAAAYAIQDAYVALLKREHGPAVAGYKIGLTSQRMQALCHASEPIAGVVLASRMLESPGELRAADYIRLCIECELAVRIGADIGLDAPPLTATTVGSAIDRVAAAFEIVDDADADYAGIDGASIAADNSWNAGLLLGPSVAYDGKGLIGRRGVLYRDGVEIDQGMSEDVLGDPLSVVLWLDGHLRAHGRHLRAGDWITTGSIITTKFVKPGERYEFRLDGLEPVTLVGR